MCGILAYFNLHGKSVDRSESEVATLRDMMSNRGPDSHGYLEASDRRWILAHRRLSIIDLSEQGHQPMSDPSGRIHIVYNGEIYNFRALRKELLARGHHLRSSSDTEIILLLYQEAGVEAFARLQGMFAIAIVDDAKGNMVIARDPVGKKPLYYADVGGNVIVASTPGVIARDRAYERGIDAGGLYSLLTMGAVKSPGSLFRGIYKLEPGCYRVIDRDFRAEESSHSFFRFALRKKSELHSDEGAIDELDRLLDQAVERRMISDVPFGVYLSAGIDSALIVSYMSRRTDRVNTFSIDLAMSEESRREGAVAASLARQFGTNHHSVQLTDREYIDILDDVVFHGSTMAVPDSVLIAKLSQLARANGVYVIETGEGADELFFGYRGYLPTLNESYEKLRKWRGAITPALARAARPFGTDARLDHRSYLVDGLDMRAHRLLFSDFLYQPYLSYQAERLVGSYLGAKVRVNKFDMLDAVVRSQVEHVEDYAPTTLSFLWNQSYRWADLLLDRIDSATMSAGVEGRAPFLDVDVINFALSLADSLKFSDGTSKYVLRKIAERRVSKEHAALPKRGFGGGSDNMLNDAVCAYMRERLASSPSYKDKPLMRMERLTSPSQLFTVTSFHAWVDNWM